MQLHANAKLGLSGRHALVCAIEGGLSLRAAAAAFSVSPATAHRWWHRWLAGERRRAALRDVSSRPHRQPRRLSRAEEEPILRARRETGYGPGRRAWIVDRARSTIWKVLRRHGLSPRPRPPQPPPRRYEWSRPGALLHVDGKRLVRFARPGHRVTGDRQQRSRAVGFDYRHCVGDDNSRYAHVELHPRGEAGERQPAAEDRRSLHRELQRSGAHHRRVPRQGTRPPGRSGGIRVVHAPVPERAASDWPRAGPAEARASGGTPGA